MADALLSTPVALVADAVALTLLCVAGSRVRRAQINPVTREKDTNIVPLMGVLGAFVFAAQMLNFSVPGTGSSGHVIGGVLLASFLGPWAAFITLSSVLFVQCLLFADGGLLALGCNLINMGACSCLIAYPLIFRPMIRGSRPVRPWKIMVASVVACILGLELGAILVTGETVLSRITALTPGRFLSLMCGIHLAIGAVEGVATGAVLVFVARTRPDLLQFGQGSPAATGQRRPLWKPVAVIGGAAVLLAGFLYVFASSDPDGLEWSISALTGSPDIAAEHADAVSRAASVLQTTTAAMPDYDNVLAGIVGAAVVLVLLGIVCMLLRPRLSRAGVRVKK